MNTEIMRCPWCGTDPLYVKYHDEEWRKAVHDEKLHFEFLLLESFQAGIRNTDNKHSGLTDRFISITIIK